MTSALPNRRPRADYRHELGRFMTGPGPYISVYLDVTAGAARDSACDRLRAGLRLCHGLDPTLHAAAVSALDYIHDDDRQLVVLIDGTGHSVITGYAEAPVRERMEMGPTPRVAELLMAEQRLTHHTIATVEDDEITITTVPRHGEPSSTAYRVTDRMAIAPLLQHVARETETRLLILCCHGRDLGEVGTHVLSGLPLTTTFTTIVIDDIDASRLDKEIAREAEIHAAERTDELTRLLRFHRMHDEAVEGRAAVIDALESGRAGLVLLHPDQTDSDEVMIRAALVSGCPIHLLGSDENTLDEGAGAMLTEHTDAATLADLLEL